MGGDARGGQLGFPPFWRPLSDEERFVAWATTGALCDLVGAREVDRAVCNFKREQPPRTVPRSFRRDPIAFRMIVYAFNDHRDDVASVPFVREYVNGITEPQHLLGLGPSLVKDGVPLEWVTKLAEWFTVVWLAQDAKATGNPCEFEMIQRALTDERQPVTTTDAEGTRTVIRRRAADASVLTCTFLDRPDGTKHEEYVWDVPEPIDPNAWREMVDQMHVRWMQQWQEFPRILNGYFANDDLTRRVTKLVHDGRVIAERPMHLTENYQPMMRQLASRYTFEPDDRIEAGAANSATPSEQETSMALFQAVLIYEQRFGRVPGVLRARTRGELTARSRAREVSHKIVGQRQLADAIDHSGDGVIEKLGRDEDDNAGRDEEPLEAVIDSEARVRRQDGAPLRTDELADPLVLRDALARLIEADRQLADMLLAGLTPADAARELGVSTARISQRLARMRPRLAPFVQRPL